MKIKKNKKLSDFATFGIGGLAEYFVEVAQEEDLKKAIEWARSGKTAVKVCAGASNIVFPDETLKGLLVRIKGGKINRISEKRVAVDAGVSLLEFLNFANEQGLEGVETLAGIPGTVGGAVAGNAGAYGRSISESVKKVKVLDISAGEKRRKTDEFWITQKECGFDYRESVFKHSPLLATKIELQLQKGDAESLKKKSTEIIKIREAKYRPRLKCPGSFFKNVLVKNFSKKALEKIDTNKIIEGKIPAGWLLEEVGAKGMRCGGIKVADFHGNLFINEKNGTAKEVKRLADELKKKVKQKFEIELEEEVKYF